MFVLLDYKANTKGRTAECESCRKADGPETPISVLRAPKFLFISKELYEHWARPVEDTREDSTLWQVVRQLLKAQHTRGV